MTQVEAKGWVQLAGPRAQDLFAVEQVEVGPGAVMVALSHAAKFEHRPGWFQAAVPTAIGEYAAGDVTGTTAGGDPFDLALDQTIHFTGPARGKPVIAHGQAFAPARRVSYACGCIFVEEAGEGRMCAALTLTMRYAWPRA